MKAATLSLGSHNVSGWYSKTPHAFVQREEMGRRMMLGLAIAVALYVLVLSAYFIAQNQQEPLMIAPTRKPIVINAQEITPPTPPDMRLNSKPVETVSTKDIAGGILENLKNDKALTNSEVRDAVKMAATIAIETRLSEALSAIDKAFGDGPPTPIEGSKNTGVLAGLEGRMGGLIGLSQGGATGFGLGVGTQGEFKEGGNSGGLGDARRETVGGGIAYRTGLSRSDLKLAVRTQKLVTKEDLRPATEIAGVLEKYQPALEQLYTQYSSAISNCKATVQFIIAPDGVVVKSQVVSKSFSNTNFERELARRIGQMRFSTIKVQANQTVTAPFNFSEESIN
jgi:hypothetical protein